MQRGAERWASGDWGSGGVVSSPGLVPPELSHLENFLAVRQTG